MWQKSYHVTSETKFPLALCLGRIALGTQPLHHLVEKPSCHKERSHMQVFQQQFQMNLQMTTNISSQTHEWVFRLFKPPIFEPPRLTLSTAERSCLLQVLPKLQSNEQTDIVTILSHYVLGWFVVQQQIIGTDLVP